MMERILVTGAAGFIGKHLVCRLSKEGYAVRALVRNSLPRPDWKGNVEVVQGDVRDRRAMRKAAAGVKKVFHLAGKAHALSEIRGDESLYYDVNVQGARNVLEEAAAAGAGSFVFFSSVKAMGEGSFDCLDESVKPDPVTPYGRSKLEAEKVMLEHGENMAACLRLPLVYGQGNKGNLYRMISAVDRGFFPPLPGLENRRSMVHVANVIEAALLASDSPAAKSQCYIVTDDKPYSTRQLYEMICRGLGKQVPRWQIPLGMLKMLGRIGDLVGRVGGKRFIFDSEALEKLTGSACYSSRKISRELGYHPLITFEEALFELITWYREEKMGSGPSTNPNPGRLPG